MPGAPTGSLGNVEGFDTTQETCTPFLNMPGTFLANTEYWKIACQAVPTKATYIKMTTGDVVDYFKPKEGKSICDMLTSSDQHLWSLDGGDVVDYFKPKEGKIICDMLTSSDQHLWSLDG